MTIAPSYRSNPAEFIKTFSLYCGLVDFSAQAVGMFNVIEAERTKIKLGLWQCRTVRLTIHDWEVKIALRWELHQKTSINLF